jgi:hypothetical protein
MKMEVRLHLHPICWANRAFVAARVFVVYSWMVLVLTSDRRHAVTEGSVEVLQRGQFLIYQLPIHQLPIPQSHHAPGAIYTAIEM